MDGLYSGQTYLKWMVYGVPHDLGKLQISTSPKLQQQGQQRMERGPEPQTLSQDAPTGGVAIQGRHQIFELFTPPVRHEGLHLIEILGL